MTFDDWIRIGKDIYDAYEKYDGFVVLHGTDTLAYTACALSFMFENLGKPVVITGAQVSVVPTSFQFEIRSICNIITVQTAVDLFHQLSFNTIQV